MPTHEEIVGAAIADRRSDLGMSQTELAEKVGISQAKLSRIERGVKAKAETLRALLNCLNIVEQDLKPSAMQGVEMSWLFRAKMRFLLVFMYPNKLTLKHDFESGDPAATIVEAFRLMHDEIDERLQLRGELCDEKTHYLLRMLIQQDYLVEYEPQEDYQILHCAVSDPVLTLREKWSSTCHVEAESIAMLSTGFIDTRSPLIAKLGQIHAAMMERLYEPEEFVVAATDASRYIVQNSPSISSRRGADYHTTMRRHFFDWVLCQLLNQSDRPYDTSVLPFLRATVFHLARVIDYLAKPVASPDLASYLYLQYTSEVYKSLDGFELELCPWVGGERSAK